MANSSLGKASLVLSATHGKLKSGLDAAYGRVQGFKNRVTGFLQGGFASSLGGKLFGDALDTTKSLTDVGKRAASIGVASDQFMGLSAAAKRAGVDSDQFAMFLARSSGKVAGGSKDMREALEAVGLSITDLQAMTPDQQFIATANALSGVSDAGKRAHLAQELYGREFAKMLPVIQMGGGNLQGFIDKQKKLGTALSETDMGKLMKVTQSMPKVQAVFEGAWNKMVVALSPILAGVGERLSKLAERAQPVVDVLVHGFEVAATLADAALGEVLSVVDEIGVGVGDWFGQMTAGLDPLEAVEAIVKGVVKGIATVVLYTFQFGKSVAAVGATIAGVVIEGLDQVKHTLAEIIRGVFAFEDAIADAFGGPKIGHEAAKILENSDLKKVGQDMQQWAADQWNGWDNLDAQLAGVDAWMNRVLAKKEEINKPLKPDAFSPPAGSMKDVLAGAFTRGSKEDYSARVRFESGAGVSMAQRQLEEQKRGNEIMKGVKSGLDNLTRKLPSLGGG